MTSLKLRVLSSPGHSWADRYSFKEMKIRELHTNPASAFAAVEQEATQQGINLTGIAHPVAGCRPRRDSPENLNILLGKLSLNTSLGLFHEL